MLYIETASMDPFFYFALEYYLMTQRRLEEEAFLFWRVEPTLMVGRNQDTHAETDTDYARRHGIHIVRRLSGGGTIYTDPNTWQYSFILPKKQDGVDFRPYTDRVVAVLCALGVPACFSGRNDILADGRKISGSAQYIGRDYLLHHGSLLFDTDLAQMAACLRVAPDKLEAKGVRSVSRRVCTIAPFLKEKTDAPGFRQSMLKLLCGPDDGVYRLTPEDIVQACRIADEKFRPVRWNFGEHAVFSHKKGERLAGGKIEFHFNLLSDTITDCRIFGDFFFDGDIELAEAALNGCPYEEQAVRAALEGLSGTFYHMEARELARLITQ